jgi:predicted nucleic acid-binding protein
MRYVVDSCVGVKWLLAEIDSDKAVRLRDDFRRQVHELIAPDIFPVEVAHALTRAERQGRITPAEGMIRLRDMFTTLPALYPYLPLLPRA